MRKRLTDRLVSPCDQRWADLPPRGEGRYCARCDTTVIDLSRLTKREAIARTRAGGCVRVRLNERGEPLFRAEPERGLRAGALAIAAALAGCSETPPAEERAAVAAPAEPDRAPEAPDVAQAPREPVHAEPVEAPLTARADAPSSPPELEMTPDVPDVVVPTPEQRALTRRKRRAARAHRAPRRPEFLGGLMPDYGH